MEEQLTIYTVLERLLGKCYGDFDQLYQTLSGGAQQGKGDASKISEIQDFLAKYRVLFIRALILVKWSKSIPELHKCFHIINAAHQHLQLYGLSADSLGEFHFSLWTKRAPMYAVPTAVDVLTTGTYKRLPTAIQLHAFQTPLSSCEKYKTILKLNDVIRMALVQLDTVQGINT